ncbi:MAG: hypothetical protein WC043_05495 [Pseudobdellovibrionaceae bacterium]
MNYKFLFFLTILFWSPLALAQEELPVRGTLLLEKDKPLPPATGEQLEEALKATEECKASKTSRTYYDCDCYGLKYLDLLQREGDKTSKEGLKITAKRACPNSADVAGTYYQRCLGWAPQERGADYEEFCTCYANEFARNHEKNPNDSYKVREYQLVQSLLACNVGSMSKERLEKKTLVERFKKSGLYEFLFPGAIDDESKLPEEKDSSKPAE